MTIEIEAALREQPMLCFVVKRELPSQSALVQQVINKAKKTLKKICKKVKEVIIFAARERGSSFKILITRE